MVTPVGLICPSQLLTFESSHSTFLGLDPSGENFGSRILIYGVPQKPFFTRLRPNETIRMAAYARLEQTTQAIFYPPT